MGFVSGKDFLDGWNSYFLQGLVGMYSHNMGEVVMAGVMSIKCYGLGVLLFDEWVKDTFDR